mgnify:FL=1
MNSSPWLDVEVEEVILPGPSSRAPSPSPSPLSASLAMAVDCSVRLSVCLFVLVLSGLVLSVRLVLLFVCSFVR